MKTKIIIILVFASLLCGCGNYQELNDMAIVTGISIDKKDDKYQVGFLIANSQKAQTSNKEGEAQTTVYTGKGDTISEATKQIDYKTPKTIYYGHINIIVVSEEIAKEGVFEVSDFFLRFPETRKQFFLIQAKDTEAKEILKIVSPLNSFPSENIATLLKSSNKSLSVTEVIDYSSFIGKSLEKGFDPTLPTISIIGDEEKGSNQENLESTTPEAYLKLTDTAIYQTDKFVGYVGYDDSEAISIINNNVTELKTSFKYKNNTISFDSDFIKSSISIKDINTININVKGKGFISEINADVKLNDPETIDKMETELNKSIKKQLKKTIKKMQEEYKADVFGFGNKLYKKYPQKWEKLEKDWNEKHFQNLNINISVDIKISSSGSLDRTMKEVKK